jgi:ABC-type nitrate/sulfonate/bicarbonate transport system substrate-binding protein
MGQRPSIILWAAFSFFSFLPSNASAQQNADRIVITYPSCSIASVDLYIAQERGFLRQENLLADVVQVRGNIGVTALLSGDAHAINNVGTIIRAMSAPTVILASDKFKLRIHGSTLDDLPNLQNGLAFSEKMLRERRDLTKRILRARSRAHRYFWGNERGTAEVLADYLNVELPVALESYRLARPAFTTNGLATEKEVEEFLRADAEVLKLREPAAASKIFDFSLQREVNQELGIK